MLMTSTDVREQRTPAKSRPAKPAAPDGSTERDLPALLQRALARLLRRTGEIAKLSRTEREVLSEVIRCADRRDLLAPIFVRRTTLAERLSCSEPTVTRALSALVHKGWITRDQVKSRRRGFQVGSIELTPQALLWLEMPSPDPVRQPEAQNGALRESQMSHALLDPKEQSKRQPADAAPSTSRPRPGEVPATLQWLVTIGLSKWAVFRLMRCARDAGALLEDVVTACRDQIARANNPFAYLTKLLGLDRDWRRRAHGAPNAATQAEQLAIIEQQLTAASQVASLGPRRYRLPDGRVAEVHSGGHLALTCADGRREAVPPSSIARALQCIADGLWHPLSPSDLATSTP